MQLIDGQPLDRALTELREKYSPPANRYRTSGSEPTATFLGKPVARSRVGEFDTGKMPSPPQRSGDFGLLRPPFVADLAGGEWQRVFSGGRSTGNPGGSGLARRPTKTASSIATSNRPI